MSWYDDAANEVGVAILAKDGPIVGPREVAAIIAKHDPNRWVPVSEGLPHYQQPIQFVRGNQLYSGLCWAPKAWESHEEEARFISGVTHWRPIVLPEVKG